MAPLQQALLRGRISLRGALQLLMQKGYHALVLLVGDLNCLAAG